MEWRRVPEYFGKLPLSYDSKAYGPLSGRNGGLGRSVGRTFTLTFKLTA